MPNMDLHTLSVSEISGFTSSPETTAPIKHSNGKKIKLKTPSKKINAKSQRKKFSPNRKNEIQEIFERIRRKKEQRKLAAEIEETKKQPDEERKSVESVRRKFEENLCSRKLEEKQLGVKDEGRKVLSNKEEKENSAGIVEKIRVEYEKKIKCEEERKLETKRPVRKKKEKELNILKPEAVKNSPIQRRKLKLEHERKLSNSIKKVTVGLQDGKKIATDSSNPIWDLWGLSRTKRT